MENKVCENKKCMNFLPAGYKHRYCEACRNRQAQKLKNGLKTAGAAAACLAVTIVTAGRINPKK